ncbi:sulfatase-like hydrolase/transferase [Kocuria flava]|uniref:sulfatase-like hydrolase/transferase n=1 Tax=Kocuria flava TaxID=446860 RepID=UPI0027E25887|nr:sulfatase-like hydrolase/transferase [Kocuria flava]
MYRYAVPTGPRAGRPSRMSGACARIRNARCCHVRPSPARAAAGRRRRRPPRGPRADLGGTGPARRRRRDPVLLGRDLGGADDAQPRLRRARRRGRAHRVDGHPGGRRRAPAPDRRDRAVAARPAPQADPPRRGRARARPAPDRPCRPHRPGGRGRPGRHHGLRHHRGRGGLPAGRQLLLPPRRLLRRAGRHRRRRAAQPRADLPRVRGGHPRRRRALREGRVRPAQGGHPGRGRLAERGGPPAVQRRGLDHGRHRLHPVRRAPEGHRLRRGKRRPQLARRQRRHLPGRDHLPGGRPGEHGYTNVFMGGANASFAAKDAFLRTHGYDEVKDLADWRAAGEPEKNFRPDWGLSDGRLMAHAEEEVDALHAESRRTGRPFSLTLLTLDTHEPVHVYDYCDVDTDSEVTSVFECSMAQVAGFVEHLEQQGYLEDTAVVIMGDHLKHMSAGDAFHEQLDDHEDRTVFNRIRVPGEDGALRPRVDQLSMYPTLLEAAGLSLQDGAAGLGISARSGQVPPGSAQALEPGAYEELLASRSPLFYARAWAGEDAAG